MKSRYKNMPQFGRLRLRTYLFLSFTLIAMGAIFFSGGSVVRKLGRLQHDNFARMVDFRARTLAHVIDTTTQTKVKTLEALAAQIAYVGVEPSPRLEKILAGFRENNGFPTTTVTDAKSVAFREAAQTVIANGRSVISPTRLDPATGKPTFRITSPVFGEEGRPIGVVEATVDVLDYQQAMVGFVEQDNDLRIVMLNRDGRLVAQVNGPALEPMTDLSRIVHYRVPDRAEAGHFDGVDENGNRVVGARARSRSDLGWTVVLARPLGSVLREANEARSDVIFRCVSLLCISIIAAAVLARLISKPIEAIVSRIRKIAAKDFSTESTPSHAQVFQPAEISALIASSDAMSKELKTYTENLNRVVEDRTAELTMAAQHVKSLLGKSNELAANVSMLLDSMRQAVFSINAERKIVAPFSKFTNELFRTSVEGQDIEAVLFKDMSRTTEAFGKLDFALCIVFGEDKAQWMIMEDELPKQIPFEGKTLKIDYRPLYNPQGRLIRIMFVVEDISEVLVLEKRVATETRIAKLLQQLILHPRSDIEVYSATVDRLIVELVKVVDMGGDPNEKEFGAIMRHLHTIKGNSRLFGLEDLSAYVHALEGELGSLRDAGQPLLDAIMLGVAHIEELVDEFKKTAHTLFQLRRDTDEDQYVPVLKAHYLRTVDLLRKLKSAAGASDDEVRATLELLQHVPVKGRLEKMQNLVSQLSTQLKKKVRFSVEGDDFSMHRNDLDKLLECIPHMVRNAMDHGIESAEDRAFYGKPQEGTLGMRMRVDETGRRIEIFDDGAGISAQKVVDIALTKAVITAEGAAGLSEEQKLALIFLPGFSTKSSVSDVSGRGVGMDVVKHNIESLGGRVTIESTPGKGTRFVMTLPPDKTAGPVLKLKASA